MFIPCIQCTQPTLYTRPVHKRKVSLNNNLKYTSCLIYFRIHQICYGDFLLVFARAPPTKISDVVLVNYRTGLLGKEESEL